jgi:recombination protein RecA
VKKGSKKTDGLKGWFSAMEKAGAGAARDAITVKGWLDTGNYALNWAISGRLTRGYPIGHTTVIAGDPSTGKSFLVTRALASVQEAGGVALLDDTEAAYNLEYVAALGVNVNRLAYKNSRTVKEHLQITEAFLDAYAENELDVPAVLACDSLAQMSTEHELETKLEKRDMSKAAELKAFFRIMGVRLHEFPIVHLSTNHTIANIGNLWNPRTTPGGGGPKFASSVTIMLNPVGKIKAGADYSGAIVRGFVEKNRIAPPWKQMQLAIPFDRPISRASGLLPLLVRLGIVTENGTWLMYDGKRIGRTHKSKDAFLEADADAAELLDKHPSLLEEVDARLAAGQFKEQVAPPEVVAAAEEEE